MTNSQSTPAEILIIGGGAFGISTAVALLQRPKYSNTNITILDASPQLPNRVAASWDTSRILRADYAERAYTKLVSEAQQHWKNISSNAWGGEDRYHEAALLLTAQPGVEGHVDRYLEESLDNVRELACSGEYSISLDDIKELPNKETLKSASTIPGVSGDSGYINNNCGWVNADACIHYLYRRLSQVGKNRYKIHHCSPVRRFLYEQRPESTSTRCIGAELKNGFCTYADLVVVAAGAWSPSLVNMHGRAVATGQVLSYLTLTESEQASLNSMPIYFNMSTGMFMVPAHNRELKLGRHGFGYQNPTPVYLEGKNVLVSTPRPDLPIPTEAEEACKEFLVELFPHWRDKKFSKTKLCWYCDTPSGDFLIDYHPDHEGLFLATGDSGHGFKVLPVIGEKIADAIEGQLEHDLRTLWRWREDVPAVFRGTDDGTRGGKRGMTLNEEWRKSCSETTVG